MLKYHGRGVYSGREMMIPVEREEWFWAGAVSAVGLVILVAVAAMLISRRKRQYPSLLLPPKQAVAVKNTQFKGPGGFKQTPSPLQSPLSTDSSPSPVVPFHSLLEDRTRKLSPSELPDDRGEIQFELSYDPAGYSLQVGIVGCKNLCELTLSRDGQCLLDPYVKLQLLPEKEHRVKTRIVRSTTCPVYDEQFTMYGIGPEQLTAASLHFQIVAFDRYSRDTVVGEAVYRLDDADLQNKGDAKIDLPLLPRASDAAAARGEVLVSLTYQPAFNNMTVVILKARALPQSQTSGTTDPYVKLYLRKDTGERIVKKKTHVKRGNQNPVYNESFVLELPENKLSMSVIDLQVINHDRNNRNDVIGRALLNEEDPHVAEVLANPGRQVAKWHHLD